MATINGNDNDNVLVGTPNEDTIRGRDGDDILVGRGDDDRLRGGDGDDFLSGRDGDDNMRGGDGNDVYNGGDGEDTFLIDFSDRGDDFIQDFTVTEDRLELRNFSSTDFDTTMGGLVNADDDRSDVVSGNLTLDLFAGDSVTIAGVDSLEVGTDILFT